MGAGESTAGRTTGLGVKCANWHDNHPISTTVRRTTGGDNGLGRISSVFADKHLKKALVVAEDGTVVGIINRSDINRYLVATFVPVSG